MDDPRKELIARLLADTCEICGSKSNVQVHHLRALADLAHAGWQPSDWARVMLHRRRKTVVACDSCHGRIHSERPAKPPAAVTGEPDGQGNRHVRFRGRQRGKGPATADTSPRGRPICVAPARPPPRTRPRHG
ncbi:HNH endonuclease [Embleya sp. NPDC001921]